MKRWCWIFISLALAFLLLALTSCAFNAKDLLNNNSGLSLTQTSESVMLTLTAAPTLTPVFTGTATPDPASSTSFESNGIRMMLPIGVAKGLAGKIMPAQDASTGAAGGAIHPEYIVISLTDYIDQNSQYPSEIRIYPLGNYERVNKEAAAAIKELNTTLSEHNLKPAKIPVIPPASAEQRLHAQVKYIGFQQGKGVRFLTQYDQAYIPINNQYLTYHFQGITDDGLYLVSVVLPVKAPFLPADDKPESALPPDGVPYPFKSPTEVTSDTYAAYTGAVTQKLNDMRMQQFSPDLGLLDAMITSLQLQPVIASSPSQAITATTLVTATQEVSCEDEAKFEGETVKDDQTFNPGQTFTKTWVLRNAGTCTWSTDYSLVFITGTQMTAPSPLPLTKAVQPNGIIQIIAPFTAPTSLGSYRGDWLLQNAAGKQFGLGGKMDSPLWVKITVTDAGTGLGLGDPAWIDTFDKDRSTWFLGDDTFLKGEVKEGALVWTAEQSVGDRWRVSLLPGVGNLGNLYLESRIKTGEGCTGKDSYGLVVRASPSYNEVYDNGYIIGVSCDGQFRIYRLQHGDYKSLQEWTSSSTILQGPGQTNTLGVKFVGGDLSVYINKELVAEVTDYVHASGAYGMFINSTNTANFQIFVDDIAYWNVTQ